MTVRPLCGHVAHLAEALALEGGVADGEHLVDDEDLRLEVCCHREGEADVHAARVALHRRVEEALDLGELDDLVELAAHLGAAHPEDRAVEVDVLATAQLRVEAGADLEQAADPAAHCDPSLGRLGDPAQDLQEGRLAGAVPSDDAEPLSLRQVEGQTTQRPQLLASRRLGRAPADEAPADVARSVGDHVAQRRVAVAALVADRVALAETLDPDGRSR